MSTPLSVVIPMFKTRAMLPELIQRLATTFPEGLQLVPVDDACPQHSGDGVVAMALPANFECRLVRIEPNVGQHSAILIGLRYATREFVAIMDADLQDKPEDLPLLFERLAESGCDVVCASRRGDYETAGRIRTARLYRRLLTAVTRGAVPPGAGMFLVMTRNSRERLLALADPSAPVLPAAARVGLRIRAIAVERDARVDGQSSIPSALRLRIALRALVTATPIHPLARKLRVSRWREPNVTITDV